jgi:hypothetical protein
MDAKQTVAVLCAALFILIYAVLLSYPHLLYRNLGSAGAPRSAYITLNLVGTGLISDINITMVGRGVDISIPVEFSPNIYAAGLNSSVAAQNSLVPISVSTLIPFGLSESKSVIYAGLYPNTIYRITAKGSSRPYCVGGEICPMYILLVNESINVTTSGLGTDTNATMRIV